MCRRATSVLDNILLRSCSKDQSVIALSSGEAELHAACMAAQQAMGIESMAREQGVDLDAMELQVDANPAIGIIGRQGLGKVRHLGLSYLWLQAAVRCKQVVLRKVQSGDNMADIGSKVLVRDTIQRHMENSGMYPIRPVESGDSWSSGCAKGHRHIHIFAVLLIIWSSKKNPTASRAGKGTPTPPAMTLVVRGLSNGAASRGCGQKQRETLFCKNSMVIQVTPQSRLFFRESQKQSEIQNVMT